MATKKAETLPTIKKANKRVAEQTKQKIKAVALVTKLNEYCLADCHIDPDTGQETYWDKKGNQVAPMSKTQIQGITALINKVIPNVTKTENETTVTNNYLIAQETSERINSLISQASEKAIKGEIVE